MPAPLSLDLRKRIVAHHEATGEGSILCGRHFRVGEATVRRLLAAVRELKTIQPKPAKGGPPPLIPDEMLHLVMVIAEGPGVTVDEVRQRWLDRTGQAVSEETMRRAMKRAKLTKKG